MNRDTHTVTAVHQRAYPPVPVELDDGKIFLLDMACGCWHCSKVYPMVIAYGNATAELDAAIASYWGVGVLDDPRVQAEQLARNERANASFTMTGLCFQERHRACYGAVSETQRCECECHEKDHR